MRVHVELHGRERKDLDIELKEGITVLELLKAISVRPEAVVTFRDDVPVPVDAAVADGDTFIFVEAASGGI
ncbi:MAG: MoaD/ThiS family protein [Thermoplasmata archaeon]|nr:MoaD/ThiS family protein [Candidatus Sysuiplasma acidicola]